ncbi:MAG TPA: AsmA-like C-terminal region-containing protein [Terracidiphilus sp.]|nr:AsmA-like C-terminal region-containing protein [Terracidiphilus sp.]
MTTERRSFWRRHRILMGVGISAAVVLAVLAITAAILARRVEPYLRAQIVQALSDRLHARVELDSFHVGLGNGLHGQWGVVAEGRGLRIWPARSVVQVREQQQAAESLPTGPGVPLIELDEFHFHAPLRYESGKPIVISLVRLSGLSIHVPPRSVRQQARSSQPPPQPQPQNQNTSGSSGKSSVLSRIVVERIECDKTQLVLETDKPGKLPMGFLIQQLHLTHITADDAMDFEAELTNPRPVGIIHTRGRFGPLNTDDLGESPVEGSYSFDHADLATFKGIGGILSSTGQYHGTLRDIFVEGDTDVPDFSLEKFSSPVHLQTHFRARVDGTDGDTWLDPVDATLGSSHFTTSGRIVRMRTLVENGGIAPSAPEYVQASPFEGGHDILLDIDIEHQAIDDFMRLTNQQQKPLLTGIVTVKARLHIPPGKEQVNQRLTLDGAFQLDQAQFTSQKIQSKVDELSLRAQGKPGEAKKQQTEDIDSRMQSNFHVANAVVTLPDLQYQVPGALIQLKGTYGLDGALDFKGSARMQATVSQMVGGWKGFFLKLADPIFKKDGAGALIPIHVAGTRDAPKFGLDFGRIGQSGTHPESPEHPDHPQSPDQQDQSAPQPPQPQR